MIGGAGGGYSAFSNIEMYYDLLYNLLKNKPFINGMILMKKFGLDNVKLLINKIVNDFGEDYIISTAPVAASLMHDTPGIGGFIYKDL